MQLDKSRNYSMTYGPDAARLPFYQDGLYFNAAGEMVDTPYNHEVLAQRGVAAASAAPISTVKVSSDLPPPAASTSPPSPPPPSLREPNPEVLLQLEHLSDEQIYQAAVKARETMDSIHDVTDGYEPNPVDREGNVNFIARNIE